jgi:hypothetical protein
MAKPRVEMDKLAGIPKAAAAAAVPFARSPSPPDHAPPGAGKSLTVKLEAADYWALRDYCTRQERTTGQRVTHQQVMVSALRGLLRRKAAEKAAKKATA